MKFTRIITIAVLCLGLAACNNKENLEIVEPGVEIAQQSFEVLEESEITAEDFFASTMGNLEGTVDAELFNKVHASFIESNERMLPQRELATKSLTLLYKTARVTYQTLDQDNKPVTASALIVYPLLKKINKVMLINHGTQIGFAMIPTKYTSVEAVMAATGALCIVPDYIGLGSSASHPDLYLNEEVHGRTSVDALLTLLDYAKAKKLNLDSNYKSYILGYSQGGAVSLASLRRVQELDESTQARLHLDKVFCGDGPYDLRRTFESYLEELEQGKDIALGSVIPLVINSMFNSYAAEMADINYEDFFTAWALKTGVPQAVRANKEGVIDMILKFNGVKLDKILNFDYMEANPEHLERLLSLMDRQNLCHGWAPQYKLKLMHCNPDGVVPFSNFEEAVEGLNNEYLETEVVKNSAAIPALLQHIYGMLVMVEEVLEGELK